MAQYLDQFKSSVPAQQTEQILKLLNKKRSAGQITTLEEFNAQLDSLIRDLSNSTITPTLALKTAVSDKLISSEQFNYMLERTEDDLQTAFAEASQIDTVQLSHEALVRDVSLKNIRAAIAELDAKISVYEYISKDDHGFDKSIFSTFSETQYSRTPNRPDLSALFDDPRIATPTPLLDAEIEQVGQRLVLATSEKTNYQAKDFRQIFDQDTPQSYLMVTPPNVSLKNVIDHSTVPRTYWVSAFVVPPAALDVATGQPPPLTVKFELDLAVKRTVNFIEIEPANVGGLYLIAIHFVNNSGVTEELYRPNPNDPIPGLFFNGGIGLRINPTFTHKLIFTFMDISAEDKHFLPIVEDPLFQEAMNSTAQLPTKVSRATIAPQGTNQ